MLFSIVAAPLCIPTQGVGRLHFPYVLCSIHSLEIFLMMAILTSGRGFLNVDLVCIDLIISVSSLVWLSSKDSACSAGDARDLDLVPEWGRSPGEGNGNLFQYCCPKNPMGRGAGRLESMGLQRVGHNWVAEHSNEGGGMSF